MADFIYDDLEPANIAAAQVLIAAERACFDSGQLPCCVRDVGSEGLSSCC